jgi:hypothetical protein
MSTSSTSTETEGAAEAHLHESRYSEENEFNRLQRLLSLSMQVVEMIENCPVACEDK